MRFRSKKSVIPIEECTKPFSCIFRKANVDGKVFVGVNGKNFFYPLKKLVVLDEPAYHVLKQTQKERHLLPKGVLYDPFKDPIYEKI